MSGALWGSLMQTDPILKAEKPCKGFTTESLHFSSNNTLPQCGFGQGSEAAARVVFKSVYGPQNDFSQGSEAAARVVLKCVYEPQCGFSQDSEAAARVVLKCVYGPRCLSKKLF